MTRTDATAIEDTQSPTVPLTNVTDEQIDSAIDGFVQMITGAHPETTRERGLFLANPDLRKINQFVEYANNLPVTKPEVLTYLNYPNSFIQRLEPESFIILFSNIHDAVKSWEKIEVLMKESCATLITFHIDLKSVTDDVFAHSLMQLDALYESEVGDVTAVPDMPITDNDLRKLPSLIDLTQELLATVEVHRKKATVVRIHLKAFQSALGDILKGVTDLRERAVENNSDKQLLALKDELELLSQRIEERSKTYSTYTDYAWVGAWWGPVGLIISQSIYGIKASNVKSEYNALLDKKKELNIQIYRVNKGLASLTALETDLQSLELLTAEALNGAANIEKTWITIHQHIVDSVERLKSTTTKTKLFIFKNRLSSMLEHWKSISSRAEVLMGNLGEPTHK